MPMINIQIMYHSGAQKGTRREENREFDTFDIADDWATAINNLYAEMEWHVTGLFVDEGNFAMFDISEIWDANDLCNPDLPHMKVRDLDRAVSAIVYAERYDKTRLPRAVEQFETELAKTLPTITSKLDAQELLRTVPAIYMDRLDAIRPLLVG